MFDARQRRRSLAPLLVGVSVYALWPAKAAADALVRFVHGVPGAGAANLTVDSRGQSSDAGSIAFGQTTRRARIRDGSFAWRLTGAGKTLAHGTDTVGTGAYTGILLTRGPAVSLALFKDAPGTPGKSRIRVIHAAPEFGSPALQFDGQTVAPRLDYTAATPYLTVSPGAHTFAAMTAGGKSPALGGKVRLAPNVSYTAIVVGTRGQMVRVVTLTDPGARTAPPAKAPHHAAAASPRGGSSASSGAGSTNSGSGTVTVHRGDSLWEIARRRLAPGASPADVQRYVVAIWNVNARAIGTGDPNLIFPGQRLRLPARRG